MIAAQMVTACMCACLKALVTHQARERVEPAEGRSHAVRAPEQRLGFLVRRAAILTDGRCAGSHAAQSPAVKRAHWPARQRITARPRYRARQENHACTCQAGMLGGDAEKRTGPNLPDGKQFMSCSYCVCNGKNLRTARIGGRRRSTQAERAPSLIRWKD